MEVTKQVRRRLAIGLLAIMAMVFALVPFIGTQVAEARTSDLVQTYTPTESCPVSKVEYVPQSNGSLHVKVTVDLDCLESYVWSTPEIYYGATAYNKTTGVCFTSEEGNLEVKGTKVFEYTEGEVAWNQDFTFKFSLYDTNPQFDPPSINNAKSCIYYAPTPFKEFSAEYYEGASDEYVEVKFTDYYKSDSGYNLFLREDTAAGTIKQLDYTTYKTKRDSNFIPGRTYVYYVVKSSVLQKAIPELHKTVGSTEKPFSAADQAKLRGISSFGEVAVPGPPIVTVNSLKVSPSVRSATLAWQYDYETVEPNVTGFYVKIYNSNGSLYKRYKNTSQTSSNCSAKYSIPYSGTYYFTVTPYYEYYGNTYIGTETAKVACKSKSLSAASGSVTKISDKKARITIKKATGSTGTMVYQYVSGKWKYMGKTTGTAYTVTKNTAGKKKYKLLSYISENGKTYKASKYSGTYSPKANVAKFSYSSNPSSYAKYSHFWRPVKIYYSGSKVVVTGKFINTHIYALDNCKIKLSVTCQGKVIGTKTINSGTIKANKVKTVTVKLDKSKTGCDLRACFVGWDYRVISYS